MKTLLATLLLSSNLVWAAECPTVRAFSCPAMHASGETLSFYVGFDQMMKVLGGGVGRTYDESQGFGEHTNCAIPVGAKSSKIKLRTSDVFRTGSVSAQIEVRYGRRKVWTPVYCSEIEF